MLRQLGPRRSPVPFQIRKKGKDLKKPSRWPIRTPLRPTGQSPPRSRVADLPSSGSLISASLEDSGPALERVANLRLARGRLSAQGTNGPAAQPTAVRRHLRPATPPRLKGRAASDCHSRSGCDRRPVHRPRSPLCHRPRSPLCHPSRCSSTVGIQCGTRQVGTAPVTVLPTSIARPISRWGRGPTMSRVLPRGALSTHGRDPGPPPRGVRDFHALPDLLMCTPALRPGGPGPSHAITTTGTLQDGRRHLHGTKDENPGRQRHAPPSHSTLSTVFDHCTPRFKGERRLPRPYTHLHRPSLQL